MRVGKRALAILAVVALTIGGGLDRLRAETEGGDDESKWSNSTELSVVVTEGNSRAETFGFKNTLERNWERSRFRLKLDGVRSDTADDRFVVVDPGITWPPGNPPDFEEGGTTVEPGLKPDVERYFAEGRYDREISNRLGWHAGASWDRNEDAGILNRYIAFGGMGHTWRKEEDLEFQTSYGLSLTDRELEEPDPDKDDNFAGVRLSWDYLNRFGKAAVYENDFTANVSLKDTADYSLDMTNSLGVSLTHHLALKVSLQFLYEAEPALEEVDLVAYVIPRLDDTGEVVYETVPIDEEDALEIVVDDRDIRKDELDTIFRTSLVVNF